MYKVNEAYLQFKCAITSIQVFSYTLVIGTSSTLTFYQVQEQAVDTNRSEVYYKSLVCTTTLHKQNQVSTFHFLYLLPTLYLAIFFFTLSRLKTLSPYTHLHILWLLYHQYATSTTIHPADITTFPPFLLLFETFPSFYFVGFCSWL